MTRKAWCAAAIAVALAGCHTITEELPTQPTESPGSGILTLPIPSIPLPTATPGPAPQPTATPGATPPPAPQPPPEPPPPPGAGSCGNPVPPPIGRVNVKIHIRGPRMYTLDSTPQVVDPAYCAAIGFPRREARPARPEGHPGGGGGGGPSPWRGARRPPPPPEDGFPGRGHPARIRRCRGRLASGGRWPSGS